MTINELRESDLNRIIKEVRWDYNRDFYNLEHNVVKWAERGEPIKKSVLYDARALSNKAERNLEYLKLLLEHFKVVGYVETEEIKKVLHSEVLFYESEKSRLNQLKLLVPLVKPIAQLKSKGEQ